MCFLPLEYFSLYENFKTRCFSVGIIFVPFIYISWHYPAKSLLLSIFANAMVLDFKKIRNCVQVDQQEHRKSKWLSLSPWSKVGSNFWVREERVEYWKHWQADFIGIWPYFGLGMLFGSKFSPLHGFGYMTCGLYCCLWKTTHYFIRRIVGLSWFWAGKIVTTWF